MSLKSIETADPAEKVGTVSRLEDPVQKFREEFEQDAAKRLASPAKSEATELPAFGAVFEQSKSPSDKSSLHIQVAELSEKRNEKSTERQSEPIAAGKFHEFARKNGLELKKTADQKLEFGLQANGERLSIATVEQTKAGLEQLEKILKETKEAKRQEIEEKYQVKIAGLDDPKPRQQVPQKDGKPVAGKELALREPKLKELLGIEAALEKAHPSQLPAEGKDPLRFYFLKDSTYYKDAKGVATFESNIHGAPAVIVEPNTLDKSPVSEKDRKKQIFTDHHSIESVIIHELGHNTEDKLFKTPEAKAAVYDKLGWSAIPQDPKAPQHPDEVANYMLRGPQGIGYAPAGIEPGRNWLRLNKSGQVRGAIHPLSAARLAEVKPATQYFEGPHEVLAEGLTMLRLGDQYRSHMLNRDQKLYDTIKEIDQKELDVSFGQGKFMRSYDGKVVEQSRENLRLLKEAEDEALKNSKKSRR